MRTICWYRILSNHLEARTPRDVQRVIAPQTIDHDLNGEPIKNNKFLGYARGEHVPSPALIEQAEAIVPRSSWMVNHLIWQILRASEVSLRQADKWARQLSPEIQAIIVGPYQQVTMDTSRHTLGALERRAGFDSVAALTLLFRLHHHRGNTELSWQCAHSIFRVLLLMGSSLDRLGVAEEMFQLYVERIFSLARHEGKRMDLAVYDYRSAMNNLAGIADRVRDRHASVRDRKMPTFYALQALTGQYQHRFRKYFEIPLADI